MGTIVSIDVRTPLEPEGLERAFAAAAAVLHDADETFSTYRADSWVCRIARGEATLEQAPAQVREVYALAEDCRLRTGGAFDPAWRADGTLDPTGLVKGWAADRASSALCAVGAPDHCVNAAGDLRVRGASAAGQPWRVGIADPLEPTRLVAVVEGRELAVATSGLAHQSDHVVDPRTGRSSAVLASVTVVGPDLALADAYATAGLAAGPDAETLLADLARDGWSWLVVEAGGAIRHSPTFPGRVASAATVGPTAFPGQEPVATRP
ncbi:MAG: FAD:protein FMN transferase [Frankia sp.]